jgi:DNA polymerase-3 subunit beta
LQVNVASARRIEVEGDKEAESKSQTATLHKPISLKAIIPARACTELVKLLDSGKGAEGAREVRLVVANGQVIFETDTHYLSSRLISGEYPRYHELFPAEYKYLCHFKRDEINSAIDRVAVMSDDRTHLIKMHFEGETLQVSANTPDIGRAQEEVSMRFEGQVIDVAVNVKYISDVLQRLAADEVQLEMTGPLKPLILKPSDDENYKYLLMPVQAK